SPANADDGTTAPRILGRLTEAHRTRPDEVSGDNKFHNRTLDHYPRGSQARYRVTVVKQPQGVKSWDGGVTYRDNPPGDGGEGAAGGQGLRPSAIPLGGADQSLVWQVPPQPQGLRA